MNRMVMTVAVVLTLVGCGGGGKKVTGSPMNIDGQWDMAVNETLDTCGLTTGSQGVPFPLDFRQTGSDVRAEALNAFLQACTTWLYFIDGNTMTWESTETVSDGVCAVRVGMRSTLGFSNSNHFSGSETYHVTYSSGDCGGFQACDWNLASQGDRCNGCWPGCVRSSIESGQIGMAGTVFPKEEFFGSIRKQD